MNVDYFHVGQTKVLLPHCKPSLRSGRNANWDNQQDNIMPTRENNFTSYLKKIYRQVYLQEYYLVFSSDFTEVRDVT